MLDIRNILLDSSQTLLSGSLTKYNLENDCIITGYGYGEALAKYIGHLAIDLKLNIRFENLSSLIGNNQRVTIIMLDENRIIDKISNKNTIIINKKENIIDTFMFGLYELCKSTLLLANKQDEVTKLNDYINSYSKENLLILASNIEKAVSTLKAKKIDYIGEGYETSLIDFVRTYNAHEFGSFSSFENSEDYHHINVFLRDSENIYTPMIINSCSNSVVRLTETVKVNDAIDRKMCILTDIETLETKSPKIMIKKADYSYFMNMIEGYAYLYMTSLMVTK